MNYYSARHQERYNKLNQPNYLKEEINMEHKKELRTNIIIGLALAVVFAGAFSWLLSFKVQEAHKAVCNVTYQMGETGYYCQ